MSPDGPPRAWGTPALYVALAAIALFPLATVDFPPLADLPNHLARAHIIGEISTNPDLARHYSVVWQLLAFQSSDLILPWLLKGVGAETAARLFVVASFATLITGVLALHKALFGRVGPWPALAFLLLYNFMLGWGLLSYLLTAGLALILLAGWIETAARESPLRTAGFALGALVLFFMHFLAFAAFALTVASFELWQWRQDRRNLIRRMILSGAVFAVPSLLFLLSPRATIPMLNDYGEVVDKVRAAMAPFNLYFGWQDLALEGLTFLLLVIGILTRRFPIAPPLRWPLIAVGVAMLLMPNQLMSVWGSDFRLPTVFLLMLIAGTELPWRKGWQVSVFATIVVGILLLRTGQVTHDWRRFDADIGELRAAMTRIDRGSKVVVTQGEVDHREPPAASLYPYRHFGAFAALDRDVFLPHLFSSGTPLRFISPGGRWNTGQISFTQNPEWHPEEVATSAERYKLKIEVRRVTEQIQKFDLFTSTTDWSDWPEQFDYLIDFHYGAPRNPVPELLTALHEGSYFTLYRIHPASE